MKKIQLLSAAIMLSIVSIAQNPTYQQKLFYTCKVWGFVKYFHSNVSTCGVNWDSVLIHCLPLVKSAVTSNDFNNALDTMLNAAGPMAITHTPPCDTVAPELSRNLNFGWINSPVLRNDVQIILDTIKNNFRPHAECWVQNSNYMYSDVGYLLFPDDSLMLNQNFYMNFPDEWHKLMVFFKEWNVVNYFNPYNYIHNEPWDSALYHSVIGVDNATNDQQFYYAIRKLTAQNNDAHTEGLTGDGYCNFPGEYSGWYSVPIILKYVPNQYVAVKSAIPGITNGDAIVSINGLTTKQWEDSLGSYISAGDSAVFRRTMSSYLLYGNYRAPMTIVYTDSMNNSYTITAHCDSLFYDSWFYSYYPNDTLANAHWKYWPNCNIGYANVGQMLSTDVAPMYSALQNTSAIIFDIRNYPTSNFLWTLLNYMLPGVTQFAKFTIPDVTYPGTYYWSNDYIGVNGNATPYNGKIIILFNEETQSAAEFDCMGLEAMPNVVKIGSQTAGTDGNVTYYRLNQYTQTGFTTLGVFYPNGDSTERIGIKPDILMYPTQEGIRQGRDEVLEKALEIAGCPLGVQAIVNPQPSVSLYPNPSNGQFTIALGHAELVSASQTNIEVYNVLGKNVYNVTLNQVQGHDNIDLSSQPNGVYLYRVITQTGNLIGEGKLIIQK